MVVLDAEFEREVTTEFRGRGSGVPVVVGMPVMADIELGIFMLEVEVVEEATMVDGSERIEKDDD